jgi:hypothetical protein
MADTDAQELARHVKLVDVNPGLGESKNDAQWQDIRTAPLFTSEVRRAIKQADGRPEQAGAPADPFPQYGLLGIRQATYTCDGDTPATPNVEDNLVYANMNAPWSTFICGSQGGSKSHTLSCLLENSLLASSPAGNLPTPLAGLVFHYDKFTSMTTTQLCEAA